MRHPLLAPDLREMIADGEAAALRDFFAAHHPADTAELLDDLGPAEVLYVLRLLDGRTSAAVFSYLDPPLQEDTSKVMDRSTLATLVTYMSHDERADLISRLPPERTAEMMPLLAQAEREDIRRLAAYGEGTTGSVMTSDYATVARDETAAQAINRLRYEAPDRETIYYSYVVADDRKLVGFVSLKDLILAPASRKVSDIMATDVVSACVDDDQELAAQKLMEYDLIALPVVDTEGRMVGIVTHDDVIDVIVDEATEDLHRQAGVEPLPEGYLRTPFGTLWSKRATWLSILFVGGFLTTTAMAMFEEMLAELQGLMLFLPLIISTGGNCGSQSATLITRAIALGELEPRDWFRVLFHELLMGASLGLTLGAIGFVRAVLVGTNAAQGIPLMRLGVVVAVAVTAVVIWGNLVGALLPLVLKRLGQDPALMSNPVVASLVDVTGIVTYFLIAHLMLM